MSDIHALAPNQTCTCKARHVTAPKKEDEMSEPRLRRGDSVRYIEVLFEKRWTGLATIGTTSWSYPDGGKSKRYIKISEDALALFLAAPDLLAALEELLEEAISMSLVIHGEWCVGGHDSTTCRPKILAGAQVVIDKAHDVVSPPK